VTKIVLRMDDVGASTKHFEVYSKKIFGNFLFLKYLSFFRAWGVYEEISPEMWQEIFQALDEKDAKLTIGVTATWVERDGTLVPFPEKYPLQADLLKAAEDDGLIEIANHGLTHCVVGRHLPKPFSSNRTFHREFWDWLPEDLHKEHISESQKIFKSWLGRSPVGLIPPGNVYSNSTIRAAEENGIKYINSSSSMEMDSHINYIDESMVDAFHDREIALEGIDWLKLKINYYSNQNTHFVTLKEII